MKTFSFLIAILMLTATVGCVTPGSVSQKNYYADKYRNRIDPGNVMVSAGAIFTVEQTPDLHFIKKEYYFDTGAKTSETSYADKSLTIRDGKAAVWYDNGNKWKEGNYKRDKKEGEWKHYSSAQNGKLSSYGSFLNDLEEGVWIGVDSLGNKSDETMYKAGKKVGETKYYNPDGTVRTNIPVMPVFEQEEVQTPPSFPCDPKFGGNVDCDEKSLLQYLSTNIKYPAKAREENITGTAILTFVVDKDGSVKDVTVIRGICDGIRDECIRIVQNMPKWKPGMVGDKPVKVRFTIPIRFRLE